MDQSSPLKKPPYWLDVRELCLSDVKRVAFLLIARFNKPASFHHWFDLDGEKYTEMKFDTREDCHVNK